MPEQDAPLPTSRSATNLLAYFGGGSSASSNIPASAPPEPKKKSRKPPAPAPAKGPKQTTLFGSKLPADASENAEAGPSGWQLAPPVEAVVEGKVKRGRRKMDEKEEMERMSGAAKKAAKKKVEGQGGEGVVKRGRGRPKKIVAEPKGEDQPAGETIPEAPAPIHPTPKYRIRLNLSPSQPALDPPNPSAPPIIEIPPSSSPGPVSLPPDLTRKRSSSPGPVAVQKRLKLAAASSLEIEDDGISITGSSTSAMNGNGKGRQKGKGREGEKKGGKKRASRSGSRESRLSEVNGDEKIILVLSDEEEEEVVGKPNGSAPVKQGPVHPFFGGKRKAIDDTPIIVDDLPSSTPEPPAPPMPLKPKPNLKPHSFFGSISTSKLPPPGAGSDEPESPVPFSLPGKTWPTSSGWGKNVGLPQPAEWPTAEDTHVCASDLPALEGMPDLGERRKRTRMEVDTTDDGFWTPIFAQQLSDHPIPPAAADAPAETDILPYLFSNDAFSRFKDPSRFAPNPQISWVGKYKPEKASEVLGNDYEATYLRDWLKELEVGMSSATTMSASTAAAAALANGDAKKQITRKVDKKRQKLAAADSWIVDDSDPIADYTPSPSPTPQAAPDDLALLYPSYRSRLTNAILLHGPHGCGKTASVYAVAEELGWEVFEVHPGIGKRSGMNLGALVGDVGKNHMVVNGPAKSGAVEHVDGGGKGRGGIFGAFGKAEKVLGNLKSDLMGLGTSNGSAINLEDTDQMDTDPVDLTKDDTQDSILVGEPAGVVKQSLILLEEVDVLFEDDKGFWQAVVALIAESRRPVVMTCNDLSLIPFEDLPLQTTLLFSPPPLHLLHPYLSLIAAHESLPSPSAGSLLPPHPAHDLADGPIVPSNDRRVMGCDLRRAIGQLQLEGRVGGEQVVAEREKGLEELEREWEVISRADAYVGPSFQETSDAIDIDRFHPSEDDETGMSLLLKPAPRAELPLLWMNSKQGEIRDALMGGAMSAAEVGRMRGRDRVLATQRASYSKSVLNFLDPIIPLDSHLLPHPVVFLDYIPYLSTMLSIDDALVAADAADAANGRPRLNRKTGRMMRITSHAAVERGYERQLVGGLTEEEMECLRGVRMTGFDEVVGEGKEEIGEKVGDVEEMVGGDDEAML